MTGHWSVRETISVNRSIGRFSIFQSGAGTRVNYSKFKGSKADGRCAVHKYNDEEIDTENNIA